MGVLCLFLAVACGYDYHKNRIPNYLVAVALVYGVVWRIATEGGGGGILYILICTAVMAVAYPLFKIGCIGAGDVKLLGVTAGYFPIQKILSFLLLTLLIAGIISIIKILKQHSFWDRMAYFCGYLSDVINSRAWKLYFCSWNEAKEAGICLSGPILASVLMYMGGLY